MLLTEESYHVVLRDHGAAPLLEYLVVDGNLVGGHLTLEIVAHIGGKVLVPAKQSLNVSHTLLSPLDAALLRPVLAFAVVSSFPRGKRSTSTGGRGAIGLHLVEGALCAHGRLWERLL